MVTPSEVPARIRAIGVASKAKVQAIESAGLVIVDEQRLARIIMRLRDNVRRARAAMIWARIERDEARATLRRLAGLLEFEEGFGGLDGCGTGRGGRAALDAAWRLLGDDVRDAERLARGCCECRAPVDDAADDLCSACASTVPPVDSQEAP